MKKTRIVIQVEKNKTDPIYLRGEGLAELNWEKGVVLKHEKTDEWVFETDQPFSSAEFKVLINDKTYELGESHPLYPGATIRVNPKFPD
ncbi:MAG: hypothetical protein S4CHLAM123_04230 [Chlamydiales bacterium]|nr:hypothetical protein [Chlamydiales bacterium]